jgi:hypothetical protein
MKPGSIVAISAGPVRLARVLSINGTRALSIECAWPLRRKGENMRDFILGGLIGACWAIILFWGI